MTVCKRMQMDPYLSPCTKFNSTGIKDLNIKLYTLNLIEEKVGNSLEFISKGKDFLIRIPLIQALKSTISKWDLMEMRRFCTAKNTLTYPPSHSQNLYL